jgi:hypothetical protein
MKSSHAFCGAYLWLRFRNVPAVPVFLHTTIEWNYPAVPM